MNYLPISAESSWPQVPAAEWQASAEHPRVLIVDDDESLRYLFHQKLNKAGYRVNEASSLEEALQAVSGNFYHAILLDNHLKDGFGVELIPKINALSPHSKIVMLTAFGSVESAVSAMAKGASNFLLKSDSPDINISKICRLIALREEPYLSQIKTATLGIMGQSQAMHKIYEKVEKISQVDTTVLISGESGTGKELIAKAIHHLSPRHAGPLMAINCGAISESLLEAELFGCKKGAYTDSKRDRKGYFETCSDGTLLLDEIGEMSPSLQVKLLRVLQEKEITPLGSCQAIKISTRILAATNRDLKSEVKAGRFREDLYYRLAVINLEIPPLRDRKEDIPVLVEHFVEKFNVYFGKKIRFPSHPVLAKIKAYDWPGNIRELRNALERAVLFAENDKLQVEDLIPANFMPETLATPAQLGNSSVQDQLFFPLKYNEAKAFFEKHYVDQLLQHTQGNIMEAARISGQYRPNIYRLLKKYDIDPNLYK